jgi:dephospho-CoA kinase
MRNDKRNIVLAVVGLAGTGKSELTRLVSTTHLFTPIYFGGCILDELRRRKLDVTSQNEKLVREDLRSERGMHVIAELTWPRIQSVLAEGSDVVIDGLYSKSEYEYLKQRLSSEFYLLAVHAPRTLRYERLARREQRGLTSNEVDSRDYFELKNLEKCEPIVLADYHIVNEDSVAEMKTKLDSIILELSERGRDADQN